MVQFASAPKMKRGAEVLKCFRLRLGKRTERKKGTEYELELEYEFDFGNEDGGWRRLFTCLP
jgi:hypothetical protein